MTVAGNDRMGSSFGADPLFIVDLTRHVLGLI